MIERYTLPEMGTLWNEEAKFRAWLRVEIAVCRARARAYAAVELIDFPGMQYRTDIALEALEMEEL